MSALLTVISLAVTVVGLALFAKAVRSILAIVRIGQADPTRSDHRGERVKTLIREVLGHTRMRKWSIGGIAHWFVFVGFGSLALTLVTAYGQLFAPEFAIPFLGHFAPYEFFVELISWLTGLGIVTLIGIRQATRIFRPGRTSRFYGSSSWQAYYVEATILAIVLCVIALRGLEGALEGETSWNWHYALSWPAVLAFNGLSTSTLESLIVLVAAIKIVVSMVLLGIASSLSSTSSLSAMQTAQYHWEHFQSCSPMASRSTSKIQAMTTSSVWVLLRTCLGKAFSISLPAPSVVVANRNALLGIPRSHSRQNY